MKKISFFLIACLFAVNSWSQDIEQFIGKYFVNGIYTQIGVGYSDSIDTRILTVRQINNQISLVNDYDVDSLMAVVISDSLIIYNPDIGSWENSASHIGKGRLSNDTLYYQYIIGNLYGLFEYRLVGVKMKENSVNNFSYKGLLLKCFPNPFTDFTSIDIDIPCKVFSAFLKIYSENGLLILNISLPQRGSFNQIINTSVLNDGVYNCILWFDNQSRYNCKIIKL